MQPPITNEIVFNLDDEIHVWTAELDVEAAAADHLQRLLSPTALQRIARFKAPELRRRHMVATATLFRLLAQYTNHSSEDLEVGTTAFGKPYLLHHPTAGTVQFSVADSDHIAIYAFTKHGPIGVDLEEVVPLPEWPDMADVCLSAIEKEWIRRLPVNQQEMAFLQVWTIKEAYLKAIGTGLSISPTSIEVEFDHCAQKYKLLRVDESRDSVQHWKISTFSPRPSFLAALVYPDSSRELRCFCCESDCRN